MRDTSDMMEDALSEDTMMDCGGDDGGLEDFVDLATDIAESSPTIRDAAERLLTLLGMDEGNEDLLSSSEDEGVEVDIDELANDDEGTENTKLLHQLAASLAQELKYSHTRSPSSVRVAHQGRGTTHSAEMLQNASYHDRGCLQDQAAAAAAAAAGPKAVPSVHQSDFFARNDERNAVGRTKLASFGSLCQSHCQEPHGQSFGPGTASHDLVDCMSLDRRLRMDDPDTAAQPGKYFGQQEQEHGVTWAAGWDACAIEALRYLVEDEGLPLHHPTVIAMKNHLDLQRDRAFGQYTGYTETKPQDMSLVLD